jgi:magnesium chelatase subunit D
MNPSGTADLITAAALMAIDPQGIGGLRLRGAHGPNRNAWFDRLADAFGPQATPLRRVPCQITEARLLGGLDLAATLAKGQRVAERGLLEESDGRILVLQNAERLGTSSAMVIALAHDTGIVQQERDGISRCVATRYGLIACDEGIGEECPPPALLERLGLWVDLDSADVRMLSSADPGLAHAVERARQRLSSIETDDDLLEAMCVACLRAGILSLRVPSYAVRVARAAAALAGASRVEPEHAALAARLVIAPRARDWAPPPEESAQDEQAPPPPPQGDDDGGAGMQAQDAGEPRADAGELTECVIEATQTNLPPDLLAALARGRGPGVTRRTERQASGRTPLAERSASGGRPIGSQRMQPGANPRLHILDTLRAAAPWQTLRRRERDAQGVPRRRIEVRRDDFRVQRCQRRRQTTVIFAVDASGSAALHRLAEAKGAVEHFLADCYVRRDQVALIAFHGTRANVLLAPTRSLTRAQRCLAEAPGGGGTPIAAGLLAATTMAESARRRGEFPLMVVLTDGRANIALDGRSDRVRATADAALVAKQARAAAIPALLVDCAPRPQAEARQLAQNLGANYLPLPRRGPQALAGAVRAACSV